MDQVVHGSARVLEKGETIVGILSPLAYGVHERITVFTHPALILLLTPNIWIRGAVLQGSSGLALEGGYQQSLLVLDSGSGTEETASQTPGFGQLGAVYSQRFTPSFQLSAALGYLIRFGEQQDIKGSSASGLYYRLGGHLLLGENHLVIAELRGNWLPEGDFELPSGTLVYAHQFGRARLGVGLVAGDFPIRTDFTGTSSGGDPFHLYVYPWLDVWWRF